eukprot:Rmarinus@m.24051
MPPGESENFTLPLSSDLNQMCIPSTMTLARHVSLLKSWTTRRRINTLWAIGVCPEAGCFRVSLATVQEFAVRMYNKLRRNKSFHFFICLIVCCTLASRHCVVSKSLNDSVLLSLILFIFLFL